MERVLELSVPSPRQSVHTSNAGGAHLGPVRKHFPTMFESMGPLRRGRRWLRVELLHEGKERVEDLLERERGDDSTFERLNHRTAGACAIPWHRFPTSVS